MKLTVLPATPARWPDVETVFASTGCAQARNCWCMFYRKTGPPPPLQPGKSRGKANKAELKALVNAGESPGLIAYRGNTSVGWVSLGPREEFKRLERSPVMKPVDDKPVWSIICFVVPPQHRGQGIGAALLKGAIVYARKHGATIVEAYPVDKAKRSADDNIWFGAKSMYDKAGFAEVARRKPARPVVRLALRRERRSGKRARS
jgi:ribosomal protein S18 acetylase RimI-like enzyme